MPENCRQWQGLLAEHILASRRRPDRADPAMDDDLAGHLAGCQECQAAAVEFRSSAAALAHTNASNSTPSRHRYPVGCRGGLRPVSTRSDIDEADAAASPPLLLPQPLYSS
jgi:hypothetical protein